MATRRPYASRKLRTHSRSFVADNRWPLAWLAVIYAATLALGQLLGGHGYAQGFMDGAFLGVVLTVVLVLFFLHTGSLNQVAGIYGEHRTEQELTRARKRKDIWEYVRNVELERVDIDAIVVAPGGVLALEVKWKTGPLDADRLAADVAQARRGAALTRSVLRSADTVKEVHEVTPVLVLWGAASHDLLDGGETHDGVYVIAGQEIATWFKRLAVGPVAQDNAAQMAAALRRFAESRTTIDQRRH